MAFTEQRGTKWRGGFRIPGQSRKVWRSGFDYQFEAEAWAVAAEGAARKATEDGQEVIVGTGAPTTARRVDAAPVGPTVGEYADVWFETRTHLARQTVDGYARHVREIKGDPIGSRALGDLTLTDVEVWRNRIHAAGVGAATVNARLKVLRMVCRRAVADRKADRDPTDGVRELSRDITEKSTISWDAEARLLAEARTAQDRAMILLGVDAGLRWQEAAAIRLDCLDGDMVVVRFKIERGHRDPVPRTKGGKPRRVPTTPRLRAALAEAIAERGALAPDDLVFVSPDGAPLDYGNWRHRTWKGLRRRAGLGVGDATIGFHTLRHTAATRWANGGIPPHVIQAWLGHASIETTEVYLHANGDTDALALIARVVQLHTETTTGGDQNAA